MSDSPPNVVPDDTEVSYTELEHAFSDTQLALASAALTGKLTAPVVPQTAASKLASKRNVGKAKAAATSAGKYLPPKKTTMVAGTKAVLAQAKQLAAATTSAVRSNDDDAPDAGNNTDYTSMSEAEEPNPVGKKLPSPTVPSPDRTDDKTLGKLQLTCQLLETKVKLLESLVNNAAIHTADLEQKLTGLTDLVDKQQKVFGDIESDLREIIRVQNEDLNKRVDDSLAVWKLAPDIVDKVTDRANEVLQRLPDDVQQAFQQVSLEPAEVKALNTIRAIPAAQAPKIPRHILAMRK